MKKSAQGESEISVEKELDLLLQITENVWVQCDNPNCQKWRKVPKEAAVNFGPGVPWYCSFNPDSQANNCSKPEENHAEYEKMAIKAGIKFVLSELELGELVWAKTAGYCRWPGVITKDPENGLHVSVDVDGDPVAYHIEYLGNPHTHCWVYAHLTETYGHKHQTLTESLKKEIPSNMDGKFRSKKSKKKYLTEKLKESNKQFKIKDAIEEAEHLLELSKSSRLRLMVFEYDPGERQYLAAQTAGKEENCPRATRKMLNKKQKSKKRFQRRSKRLPKVNHFKNLCLENRGKSVTDLIHSESVHIQKPRQSIPIQKPKLAHVTVKHCQHHLQLPDENLPFRDCEELRTEIRTGIQPKDKLVKDSLCVTKEFDAMMREIEEDIQRLSPLSQDSGEEETNFTLDDIEFDLSTMEGYFGHL